MRLSCYIQVTVEKTIKRLETGFSLNLITNKSDSFNNKYENTLNAILM